MASENETNLTETPLEERIKTRLRAMKNRAERKNLVGLARELGKLPTERARAALDVSANLAAVSLRVSREFLQAAPEAAQVLHAEDIRAWGEIGKRLAMSDAELGANFFAEGAEHFCRIPKTVRPLVFQTAQRQLILSNAIALETLRSAVNLVKVIGNTNFVRTIYEIASEVAQRSAKHSAEFLQRTPDVIAVLREFEDESDKVGAVVGRLGKIFANRTGGMTADLWTALPTALRDTTAHNAVKMLTKAEDFLALGGSVTLHFIAAGGEAMRRVPESFEVWCELLEVVAKHGNAVLIAFVRSSPQFFAQLAASKAPHLDVLTVRVLRTVQAIAEKDAESALATFRSSAGALRKVSLHQFEEWAKAGLSEENFGSTRARKSYFALETKHSNDRLRKGGEGLSLDRVQNTLRLYIEGLTGRQIEVAPLSAMVSEARINDGKTVYLPSTVSEFGSEELDFRLYKVLAAHAAGQIEFATHERGTKGLKSAFAELSALYEATAEQTDAFSLAGYIEDVQKGETALTPEQQTEIDLTKRRKLPKDGDYHAVLQVFPDVSLARKIFTTVENARVDRRLRRAYRGLNRDLDLLQEFLCERRLPTAELPIEKVPFEILFQIALCGGANEEARRFFPQIVAELETITAQYIAHEKSSVSDSLLATSRIYALFQSVTPESKAKTDDESEDEEQNAPDQAEAEIEIESPDGERREEQPLKPQDAQDLFNAWNNLEEENEEDTELDGAESWTQSEVPEQALETGDVAFAYNEWDREINDFRLGWCRVIEKRPRRGERSFIELTRDRYRGVISSIRHQFQLMKPENLSRINREFDGDDFNLDSVIEYVVDRRTSGDASERLYIKKLRRRRDVAVAFLLDQSSSTARTIARNPLQPYTQPGKRIIEIEKEGLVLMSEALEAVGDEYAIYGFTSEGRRNVKFYTIKSFDEKHSEDVEKRIGGITFQNNTRLGAAIRHASRKLLRQEARTKLLIIMTDGRPYDHDYGDTRYAREDVREALRDAKLEGITPFCVTIDRESEAEMKDLYGEVGYTIIDNVMSLPERMPNIYRRLTS